MSKHQRPPTHWPGSFWGKVVGLFTYHRMGWPIRHPPSPATTDFFCVRTSDSHPKTMSCLVHHGTGSGCGWCAKMWRWVLPHPNQEISGIKSTTSSGAWELCTPFSNGIPRAPKEKK